MWNGTEGDGYLLVSYDHVVVLQEAGNIPDESRSTLFAFDIVRLGVAEIEKVDKRSCDGRFT